MGLIKDGFLYIQNPSSGYVVNLIDAKNDNTILDTCSAPGGKASLLGQLMKNKIKITCMDINEERMNKALLIALPIFLITSCKKKLSLQNQKQQKIHPGFLLQMKEIMGLLMERYQ